jgi:hypothetical protein
MQALIWSDLACLGSTSCVTALPVGPGLQHSVSSSTSRAATLPAGALPLVEGGLSTTQHGYLSCLLQMGHLQGLLAQVEGLAVNCNGERAAAAGPARFCPCGNISGVCKRLW